MKGAFVILIIAAIGIGASLRSAFSRQREEIDAMQTESAKLRDQLEHAGAREKALQEKAATADGQVQREKARADDAARREQDLRTQAALAQGRAEAAERETERLRGLMVQTRKELSDRIDQLAGAVKQSKPAAAPAAAAAAPPDVDAGPRSPSSRGRAGPETGRNGVFLITFAFNSSGQQFKLSKEAPSRGEAVAWAEGECLVYRARVVDVLTIIEPK